MSGPPLRTDTIALPVRAGHAPSPKPPVRIFLGTEDGQWRAERVFVYSIERVRDPARVYEIHVLRDLPGFDRRGWRTGFTNYRFGIPELAGRHGRAIYNDVDQIYLADPGLLFDLDMGPHGYLAISPEDTSVMLIDCARMAPVWNLGEARRTDKDTLTRRAASTPERWGALAPGWNARDQEYVAGQFGSAPLHDPAPAALAAVPRAVLVPPASPRRALARAGAGRRRGGLSHLHAHATERAVRRDAGASPRTAAGRGRHARASGRDAEPARPGARHPIGAPLSRRWGAADGRRDRSPRRCHCVRSGLRRAVARGPGGCRRCHGSPGAAAHRGRPVGRRRAVRARTASRPRRRGRRRRASAAARRRALAPGDGGRWRPPSQAGLAARRTSPPAAPRLGDRLLRVATGRRRRRGAAPRVDAPR